MPFLVRLAREGGATLSGLRLADGRLMLRIERPGVLVRLPAGRCFPRMAVCALSWSGRWSGSRTFAADPSVGAGTGDDGDSDLLLALEGIGETKIAGQNKAAEA